MTESRKRGPLIVRVDAHAAFDIFHRSFVKEPV